MRLLRLAYLEGYHEPYHLIISRLFFHLIATGSEHSSSLCLHHVSPADRQEVARKASSVLHAGGRFICGDIFRAAEDWEERILTASWVKGMKREGAPDEVIEGMLRQRAGRLPEISTITDFRRSLLAAGFERTWVPFTHGFVGLAAGMMSTHSK